MLGTGAICIWNDIAPEGRDDFYRWHIHEHIPERVAIHGFLRGRRCIAMTPETTPEFFTLYETVDASVMTSAPYLERLNAPTPWTTRATAHFRNTTRALTRVVASAGLGTGRALATLRFPDTDEGRCALQALLRQQDVVLELLRRAPDVTGVHLCATEADASRAKTAESRDRKDVQAAPIGALLVQTCSLRAARAAIGAVSSAVRDGAVVGYYQTEFSLGR